MISSPHHAWVLRVSQAGSYKALNCLMDDWYQTAKPDHGLQSAIGFESYMGWVSPGIPNTFDRREDDIGGGRWREDGSMRSSSVRR